METRKILSIIFSLVFILGFGFVLAWGITNFNKVQEGISGTELYNQDDLNKAYQDGYDTALTDKNEYDELINSYRDTITTLNDNISQLNSQVATLTNENKDYLNQVNTLESQKLNLQEQVNNLTIIKQNNEETISQLNAQIETLQKEIDNTEQDNDNKDTLIAQKNSQIESLQSSVSQLQRTNELNVETITNLNNQIVSLNSQISDMTLQIQNNSSNVTALNNKIAELEKSVAYYEQYIANLENGEQIALTFEFAGSVYNIQIINKNDKASVVNPTSTDYVIFNYWTVNGERIDLSSYTFISNTKIVANVTYKYDVKFMVDNEEFSKQLVVKNSFATLPVSPTKDGYEFDGWTINGVDIVSNISTTLVTQNITYVAKFTKLHTVTFMYEDTVKSSQIVRNGNTANVVNISSTEYKIFNGWKLKDTIVSVENQKIYADTTFVADITYKFDVKFMVDGSEYDSQIVINNGYPVLPGTPTKDGYEFKGWSIDGVNVIENISTIAITDNTTYYALFIQVFVFDSDFISQIQTFDSSITKNKITSISFLTDTTKSEKLMTLSSGIDVYYSINNSKYELEFVAEKIYAPTSCEIMFSQFYYLESVIFDNFDTSNVIDMYGLFAYSAVKNLDLTNLDISKVTTMSSMFAHASIETLNMSNLNAASLKYAINMFSCCSHLTSINFEGFKATALEDIGNMFLKCTSLTSIDTTGFDTSKVDSFNGVFNGCSSLTRLDLSHFVTTSANEMPMMFAYCTKLEYLDISGFDTTNVKWYGEMFEDCSSLTTIIVGPNYTLNNLPV